MTGIVNITCPWCGGRVTGLQEIDHAQKIACPFCRTELHVPQVGEHDGTGWGYRELRDDEIYVDVNDPDLVRPKRIWIFWLTACALLVAMLLATSHTR